MKENLETFCTKKNRKKIVSKEKKVKDGKLMIREAAIAIYLGIIRTVFFIFKLFPQKKKSLFVTYFGYNALSVIKAVEKQSNEPIFVVTSKQNHVTFDEKENRTIIDLNNFHLKSWLRFMYHLATSDKVVVDNYYGFLAATPFKKTTKCIQLWHAAGAVKTFGLLDESIKHRSKRANMRFKAVYNRFTHVVVGSEEMAEVFEACFGLEKERMVKTGIPRTDFFYNAEETNRIKEQLYIDYPLLKEKKVLLYAPTFRDNQMEVAAFSLDIPKLYDALKDEYVLIIKTHPLVQNNSGNDYPDFVLDLSRYKTINHLLLVTDILISDYSSVPFEFALLGKPMIYYAYDLEEYTKDRGIWKNYEEMVGGPIAKTTEDIVTLIQTNQFDTEQMDAFKQKWNAYSTGQSSENLVKALWLDEQKIK